eukprot:Partr_v1_DN24353_c0_g1_i1_m32001 putative OTU domain, ubiquitin aldehyde binding
MTSQISDEQILAFEQAAKHTDAPLVGTVEELEVLKAHYEHGSPSFILKLNSLQKQGFTRFRRSRPDGNCFYRAMGFLFLEYLIRRPDEVPRNLALVRDNHNLMLSVGFDQFAFEDFEEELAETIKHVHKLQQESGERAAVDSLVEIMNDYMKSNSIVVYLRLLTSAYLRLHAEEYAPFMEDGMTVEAFCNAQVEAMDREADEMHITALSTILGMGVRVAYLNAAGSDVNFHEFGSPVELNLLYRPGHYDMMYNNEG